MVTIERAQAMLDAICEEIPSQFFAHLNGGISLLPDVKLNPAGPNLYIMGEYHRGGAMGRYITIYYGSFERVYGYLDEQGLEARLRDVLLHEFTHHLESLAGERGLEVRDAEDIARYVK